MKQIVFLCLFSLKQALADLGCSPQEAVMIGDVSIVTCDSLTAT